MASSTIVGQEGWDALNARQNAMTQELAINTSEIAILASQIAAIEAEAISQTGVLQSISDARSALNSVLTSQIVACTGTMAWMITSVGLGTGGGWTGIDDS